MQEEQNKKSSTPLMISLLVAAIIASGVVSRYSALESLRPSESSKNSKSKDADEEVCARMWQDPFLAVENAKNNTNARSSKRPNYVLDDTVCDFFEDEFVTPGSIVNLCNAICEKLISVPVQTPINTIDWLNELLKVPNLYDLYGTLLARRSNNDSLKDIDELASRTKDYRNTSPKKCFDDLFREEQHNIKRLNRLLLEHSFPKVVPKRIEPKIFAPAKNFKNVLIMPVTMTTGPYADQAEERLKTRYAILSALHVAGFKPDNPTGFKVLKAQIKQKVHDVPYECYTKDPQYVNKYTSNTSGENHDSTYDAILVLWLGNEYFSEKRLEEMDSISNAVRQLVWKSHCVRAEWEEPPIKCHFIGPQYSADLLDIYKTARCYAIDKKLKLYSPWANADPDFIEKELGITETKVDFLIPALHSYSQLTDALVDELVRRGIDLSKSDESVVIISEWDFFYGRTTQKSFAKSVQNYRKKTDFRIDDDKSPVFIQAPINTINWPNELLKVPNLYDIWRKNRNKNFSDLSNNEQNTIKTLDRLLLEEVYPLKTPKIQPWPEGIYSVSYMCGVDGKVPDTEVNTAAKHYTGSNRSREPDDYDKLITKFEQPQGQAQYDYIRRLPEKLQNIVPDASKIRAIGLFSVDIYDKLLILRALRYKYPNAIFFTTELDARLWYETEIPYTRNLVVASSYGLQLHPNWQRDIPPFRNVYQTSTFVATLQALDVLKKKDVNLETIPPRIFEIGRQGNYDITPGHTQKKDLQNETPGLHPERTHIWKQDELFTRCLYLLGLLMLPGIFISGVFLVKQIRFQMLKPVNKEEMPCIFRKLESFSYTCSKWYWIVCGFFLIIILPTFILVTIFDHTWGKFLSKEINSFAYLFIYPVLIISCLILPYFLNQNDRKDFTCLRVWKWLWIAWVVVFAIFAVFAMESSLSSDGEPITFLDGISVWPTELIRLFNGFLATYFFVISYQYVKRNSGEVTNMLTDRHGYPLYPDITEEVDYYETTYEQWNCGWEKYGTTGIIAIFHLVVGYGIIFLCGRPLTPGRGSLCLWMDRIILPFSLLLMFFFYWHVVLDMFHCQKLINRLINLKDKKYDYKCWYIVFKILAKKTEIHAKVVKYPFVLLLISCIARNDYFDNWKWTMPHAVIVSLSILLVLLVSIILFHKIKVARRKVIERLDSDLMELMEHTRKTRGTKCSNNLLVNIEYIKHIIKDIQDIKNGAFAPLSYNPILLSSLIPTGGMGVISLLQKYFL